MDRGNAQDNFSADYLQNLEEKTKALLESQHILQSVFDTSLVQMAVVKEILSAQNNLSDFVFLLVNKEMEKDAGQGALRGRMFSEIFPDSISSGMLVQMRSVVRTGEPLKIEYQDSNSMQPRWYTSMFVKMDHGLVITRVDVTERKKAEESIFKAFRLLQHSEDLAKMGSWEYVFDSGEFLWSEGMYRLFEMEDHREVQPEVYITYAASPEDALIAERIVSGIKKKPEAFEEIMSIRIGDIVKTIKVRSDPQMDNNMVTKVLGVDMDITEVKEAQEKIFDLNVELKSKNKDLISLNSELETLQSIASKDYQETLKQLYTTVEFIITRDSRNFSDVTRGNLRRAQSAIQKLQLLTDDILAFSQINGDKRNFDLLQLDEIVSSTIADLHKKITEYGAEVKVNPLPEIKGNPHLLSLLFHHLIDNALKFHEDGAQRKIEISSEVVPGTALSTEGGMAKDYYRISVKDNGIGFQENESKYIFKMFTRLNERNRFRGSGIGLAISNKIMDLHRGWIEAESTVGKGSVFHCYFPK